MATIERSESAQRLAQMFDDTNDTVEGDKATPATQRAFPHDYMLGEIKVQQDLMLEAVDDMMKSQLSKLEDAIVKGVEGAAQVRVPSVVREFKETVVSDLGQFRTILADSIGEYEDAMKQVTQHTQDLNGTIHAWQQDLKSQIQNLEKVVADERAETSDAMESRLKYLEDQILKFQYEQEQRLVAKISILEKAMGHYHGELLAKLDSMRALNVL